MLLQMARMSVDDGLVMTIHPGVLRNHSTATLGGTAPTPGTTSRCRPGSPTASVLCWSGSDSNRACTSVLFTVDETNYSREIAPLAGFYPSVFIGAPWWFLDAPDAIARFRSAVTETAGFYRGAGFIDDTRAFLSIPARHDTADEWMPRSSPGYVAEGRHRPAASRSASLTTWSTPIPEERSSYDRSDRASPASPAPGRPAAPVPDRAPRPRRLPSRPPGLVHRAGDGCRQMGHRRVHRPAPPTSSMRLRAAGRPLHARSSVARDGDHARS